MKRAYDYIADFVSQKLQVNTVFMVTGGGSTLLNYGFADRKDVKFVCNHHEQACAMAASGFARKSNNYGVALVTTGCGGTNTITALLGAWQDSIPLVVISGQVKTSATIAHSGLPLRQFGVQEADIISIVKPLCKYAVTVMDPKELRYHFEKAAYLAKNGRPGPVWLDIPQDVQAALIDEENSVGFEPADNKEICPSDLEVERAAALIKEAKRPVVVAGNGVRLANAGEKLMTFLEKHSIPAVHPFLGADVTPSDCDLHIGIIGSKGTRAGNFALQNADLVIAIGTRLSFSSIGFEPDLFAREAKVMVVDVDPVEHQKKLVNIDLFIKSDAGCFLDRLLKSSFTETFEGWASKCLSWKNMWPVCLPEYSVDKGDGVNLYYTIDYITRNIPNSASVVSDAGSAFYVTSQAGVFKKGVRYVTTGGQAEMGFSLPAAIGAAAVENTDVFAFTGDGSFQMNIQELQTLKETKLPVKVIVLNNDGYLSIRTTQKKSFNGKKIGTDSTCGLSFPSTEAIASAYGLPYIKINKVEDFPAAMRKIIDTKGPVVCEVVSIRDQEIIPCLITIKTEDGKFASKPMEDMYPFLSRETFLREMVVAPVKE